MKDEVGSVQIIDDHLMHETLTRAKASPRRRMNYNFHQSLEENPSRLLNALCRGTYVRPHRHVTPPKPESFVVLSGQIAVVLFRGDGQIEQTIVLGEGAARSQGVGIDLPPGIWHSMVCLSDSAVCFEVKPGPYVAATEKEFADWAPAENTSGVANFLERLLAEVPDAPR